MQTRKLKATESPLMLEKLLSDKNESREPKILSSPNAFDWEKRLSMPGGSPNAFALSLNGGNEFQGSNQLFDYPSLPQEHPSIITNSHELNDLLNGNQSIENAFTFLSDHINDDIYS